MHEYSVTENIIAIVQDEATRAGAARVGSINIILGELSTFSGQSIEFYFGELSRGTVAEGALLNFINLPAKAVCLECGSRFEPRHAFYACPDCGSPMFDIKQGQEMFVESIEVD